MYNNGKCSDLDCSKLEKCKPQTINKCFLKAGFGECDKEREFTSEDNLPLSVCFKSTKDSADLSTHADINQSVETESANLTVMDYIHQFQEKMAQTMAESSDSDSISDMKDSDNSVLDKDFILSTSSDSDADVMYSEDEDMEIEQKN
ncbi:hypothetical protein FQA39_LY16286 [Lamprigera yunnana]|nr:hypothetical protein FQA39_LY16286 [Lamprigera yunnana]